MIALTPQAGPESLTASRDPRLGIIAVKLKCWAPDFATALLSPALDIGISIPEWNPRQITRREAGEAGGYDVVLSYEGQADPDKEGESFEVEGSTSDDAIESHWNYEVLLKNYKGTEDPSTGRAKWPKELTDDAGAKGRNKMHGVESWRAPGLIWNHNWTARTLPSSIVDQLGTIALTLRGNPPGLSGGRNWLCVRVRAKFRGNVWQIQTSWELSGPYGWVEEMYPWTK